MFDLTIETSLSLAEACRLVPPSRRGKKTHLSTLLRWITSGAKTPDGRTIRLQALRLGGRWVTSREALQRFAEALTPRLAADHDTAAVPPLRTSGQRQRASDRAGAELEKLGI
jgi:hypothetical protein